MPLPTCSVTRLSLASLLLALLAFAFVAKSQEKATSEKPAPGAAVQTPSPPPKKLGDELDDKTGLITNTDLITLTVTVTDTYGRYVSGLSKTAFSVLDDKKPQEITFFSDDDSPVSVGVIFDVSGSMSGDKVKRARDALSKFIQTSHDSDEYFLIAFNSRAQLLLDKTR